jgi:hypothetical protein
MIDRLRILQMRRSHKLMFKAPKFGDANRAILSVFLLYFIFVFFIFLCGRLRIINAASLSFLNIAIENHNFTVVAADANYITPINVKYLDVWPGKEWLPTSPFSFSFLLFFAPRSFVLRVWAFRSTSKTGPVSITAEKIRPSQPYEERCICIPTLFISAWASRGHTQTRLQ